MHNKTANTNTCKIEQNFNFKRRSGGIFTHFSTKISLVSMIFQLTMPNIVSLFKILRKNTTTKTIIFP